jgi:hypothetical protein
MCTVPEMIRKLQNFNLVEEVRIIIQNKKNVLEELNRLQWIVGENNEGKPLTNRKYASKKYAQIKNEMNSLPGYGNMDLIATRETVNSIDVEVNNDVIRYQLLSDRNNLEEEFGEKILGTTPKHKLLFNNEILNPELVKVFREKTGAR